MERKPVLCIENLTAGYKKARGVKPVIKNISFEIYGSELACLAGANGIGKSTLLKTASGLLSKLGGEITLMNRTLSSYPRNELARLLSIVLTGKVPVGNLKAGEVIAMGRYPYTNWLGTLSESDRKKIMESITITGTSGFLDQPIHELSDGQLQKIMIARALAQDSEIILLDEPTAHLDLVNKITVMKLLKDLSVKTGKAVLIATHELELALQVSDRLLLLKNNGALLSGTPEDLVLNGSFGAFIDTEDVTFDPGSGRFFPSREEGKKIGLVAEGSLAFWTRNALERNNYSITDKDFSVTVTAETGDGGFQWKIGHPNGTEFVHTIGELLEKLKKIF